VYGVCECVDGGGLLTARLEVLVVLIIIRVVDTDESGGLLGSLGIQWDTSHSVVPRRLVDDLLLWGVIGFNVSRSHRSRCLALVKALAVHVRRRGREYSLSRPGCAVAHRADWAKVSVGGTVHAGLCTAWPFREESVRAWEVAMAWWSPLSLAGDDERSVTFADGRTKVVGRCGMADEGKLAIEAIEAGGRVPVVSIGRRRRREERRRRRRREEGWANISVDGCGGDICKKGRHVFMVVHW
jgi:hypothetical protein